MFRARVKGLVSREGLGLGVRVYRVRWSERPARAQSAPSGCPTPLLFFSGVGFGVSGLGFGGGRGGFPYHRVTIARKPQTINPKP